MFRKMRRWKQEMPKEDVLEIIRNGNSGILALNGDGGYPYTVPMSYFFDGEKIYFHSASQGHKIDAVRRDPKVSFCIVAEDTVVAERFTTLYKSVIVFGHIHIVEDENEKRRAIEAIGRKYSPGMEELMARNIDRDFKNLCLLALTPDHITGKESMDFVKQR